MAFSLGLLSAAVVAPGRVEARLPHEVGRPSPRPLPRRAPESQTSVPAGAARIALPVGGARFTHTRTVSPYRNAFGCGLDALPTPELVA